MQYSEIKEVPEDVAENWIDQLTIKLANEIKDSATKQVNIIQHNHVLIQKDVENCVVSLYLRSKSRVCPTCPFSSNWNGT